MKKKVIAGMYYGSEGDKIQKLEAQLMGIKKNLAVANNMLATKLLQLDILDAAIAQAQELDNAIATKAEAEGKTVEEFGDADKYRKIVGMAGEEPVADNAYSLWEMHEQITRELDENTLGMDDYANDAQDNAWRKVGLRNYVQDLINKEEETKQEIYDMIASLMDQAGFDAPKDDTTTDQAIINKLVQKLNKLLVKYGLEPFDASTVQQEVTPEDVTPSDDHDHNTDIDNDDEVVQKDDEGNPILERFFDEKTAADYNLRLAGAVKPGDTVTAEQADGAADVDIFTVETATAYNATLEGAVKAGDPYPYNN